jgi:hypothetical protein
MNKGTKKSTKLIALITLIIVAMQCFPLNALGGIFPSRWPLMDKGITIKSIKTNRNSIYLIWSSSFKNASKYNHIVQYLRYGTVTTKSIIVPAGKTGLVIPGLDSGKVYAVWVLVKAAGGNRYFSKANVITIPAKK